MKDLVLSPRANKTDGGFTRRSCAVIRRDEGKTIEETEIWFEHPETVRAVEAEDCDGHLLAVLLDAMREGRDIRIEGSVSSKLLSNLTEFQAAWNRWRPDYFHKVDLVPDTTRPDAPAMRGAVCAYSGGVDGLFTVCRHTQMKKDHGTREIVLAALVHGFDIPLSRTEEFENALQSSRTTLQSIGLTAVPVKTNFRSISKAIWEYTHGAALAAAMNCLKNQAGSVLIGSTYPYESLIIPWGSSPITDHLLSSDQFTVVHDGAAYDRIQKISAIADWKEGVDNMRVCWEGFSKDRNCGKCEKCVRTMMCFLACGKPIPSSFPPTPDIASLFKGMILKTKGSQNEWRRVINHAEKNGIRADWANPAARVIRKSAIVVSLFPKDSARRKLASRIFRKLKSD